MNSAVDAGALTALADPTRARIVQLIQDADGGRALVGGLAEALQLRQPTVSHHMGVLHSEGVVTREREGRRVWYSIDPEQADRVSAILGPRDAAALKASPDLDRIIDDLATRYRGTFNRETVARCVEESHDLLKQSGDTHLLASRTARFASDRLDDRKAATSKTARPSVLFVCVQNAGRSQLAAGILRQLAGDRVTVRTAGSAPASEVRAAIVAALDEIGVPVGGEFPKPLTDETVKAADVVITMGCGDACPVYPGRRYLDWDLEDPVGKPMSTVREIRDDIDRRVRDLLNDL
ncbi:metalloregulator ArsR/SmtB family transcription factor [Microbacterium abyssi]|uniref:metalloregulator ArsR/SmtB family transcription factor n=1 Tax=Microbacterium abyssi TaxID=2782166 RepID=UPI001887E56D|nr:metalloregulator ArsR/SmtB family transcription factor [Microbacterium sp. A18JL241]